MSRELAELNKQEVTMQDDTDQSRLHTLFTPRTDIYETQEQIVLMADMPGVKQEGVDITLEKNVLTIYGRVEQPEYQGYTLSHSEYAIGDYRRVFALSNEIDGDGIEASVKDGVLKLVLPKSKRAIPRKIAVQAE